MLIKTLLLLTLPLSLAAPAPEAGIETPSDFHAAVAPRDDPSDFHAAVPRAAKDFIFPVFPKLPKIGLNGLKKRTIPLSSLYFVGEFDEVGGCDGTSRRSSGESRVEAFAGLFEDDVVGAIVSRTRSSSERIYIGAGQVWDLTPSNDTFTVGCRLSQAITFTGPRIAPVPETLFPPRSALRGKPAFGYVRVHDNVVNIQRQWLQADKITIYASYAELMGDTEGYDRELYLGGVH